MVEVVCVEQATQALRRQHHDREEASQSFGRSEPLLADHQGLMKALVKDVLQEVLDFEMIEFLGASRNERNLGKTGDSPE